jgi:hypothetical protein
MWGVVSYLFVFTGWPFRLNTGIYGVFTYWINLRRQEMGVRLAIGSATLVD